MSEEELVGHADATRQADGVQTVVYIQVAVEVFVVYVRDERRLCLRLRIVIEILMRLHVGPQVVRPQVFEALAQKMLIVVLILEHEQHAGHVKDAHENARYWRINAEIREGVVHYLHVLRVYDAEVEGGVAEGHAREYVSLYAQT